MGQVPTVVELFDSLPVGYALNANFNIFNGLIYLQGLPDDLFCPTVDHAVVNLSSRPKQPCILKLLRLFHGLDQEPGIDRNTVSTHSYGG